MKNERTVVRFFTVADFVEEEDWLREQHRQGWKLVRMVPPCFYRFEKCQPEDVIYRLDYKNGTENRDYFQLYQDYGLEYLGGCLGWLYFRKAAAQENARQDEELFSDNASRLDLIGHVIKTRLLPLLIFFFCCIVPNLVRSMDSREPTETVLTVIFCVLAVLYIYLIVHCGTKLRRMKQNCEKS